MSENFDLQKHITDGVESIIADSLKATLKDPKQSAFMMSFAKATRKASKIRLELENEGIHAPAFLIASVTSTCNLHCAGCYSRCINTTTDEKPEDQLTGEEWERVFNEAVQTGISFILIAGGEPMMRRDIIEAAGRTKDILFPIFTNGTFFNESYVELFERCRNLVPVLSIEGGRQTTDTRRGVGMYDRLEALMASFKERGQLFGVSVTVTTENIKEVTSKEFLDGLISKGCKLVLFVEFVPVEEDAYDLAPGDEERRYLKEAVDAFRGSDNDMIILSFPGDELAMGGCMAAGREFFHVDSHGAAEPCPFSPYSDVNVKDMSLKDAMRSRLFFEIRNEGLLIDDHKGGCVLYEKRNRVEEILEKIK